MNKEIWFASCISLAEMAVVAVFLWLLRDFASSNRNCCRSIVAECGLIPHIRFTRRKKPECVFKKSGLQTSGSSIKQSMLCKGRCCEIIESIVIYGEVTLADYCRFYLSHYACKSKYCELISLVEYTSAHCQRKNK